MATCRLVLPMLVLAAAVSACSRKHDTATDAGLQGVPHAVATTPTAVQLARKERSRIVVVGLGLPWSDALPPLDDDAALLPRETGELLARCLATMICAVRADTQDPKLTDELVHAYEATEFFSSAEQRFLRQTHPRQDVRARYGYRFECMHVFLWALGYLEEIGPFNRPGDVEAELALLRSKSTSQLLAGAHPRSVAELLDQADLVDRLHWAAIQLRLKEQKNDAIDEAILGERHRALNWLTRWQHQAWDDVTIEP